MFGMTPWKAKKAGDGGALAAPKDFPFFMNRLREEFDHMFDRFGHAWPAPVAAGDGWKWDVDVEDQENALIVRAEAPGFEPGDFDVQVRGGELVLRAFKKSEKKTKEGKVSEYQEQQCFESVTLPPGIDEHKIAATYHSGVLTVMLPKTEAGKGRKVPVKAG
jgi:HSP20 family protein